VARKEGHPGLTRMRAFNGEPPMGLTLCGPDAAVPTAMNAALGGMGVTPALGYGPGYNRIGRNEPIVIDYGCCFDGYYVDQTRIFSLGPLSDRMRRAFDDMMQVQELMLTMAEQRPTWGGIYDACLQLAGRLGYADNFMGLPGGQVSFLGHGIGLELDEYPFIAKGFDKEPLEPGMVWAFEPKVVFPGEGAIGIENTFYLTESGVKRLTFSDEEPVVL
jgi:Xaa-Pro aminopeptidase